MGEIKHVRKSDHTTEPVCQANDTKELYVVYPPVSLATKRYQQLLHGNTIMFVHGKKNKRKKRKKINKITMREEQTKNNERKKGNI